MLKSARESTSSFGENGHSRQLEYSGEITSFDLSCDDNRIVLSYKYGISIVSVDNGEGFVNNSSSFCQSLDYTLHKLSWKPNFNNVCCAIRSDGDIDQWDFSGGFYQSSILNVSNGKFCDLSYYPVSPKLIAIGCENGQLILFDTQQNKQIFNWSSKPKCQISTLKFGKQNENDLLIGFDNSTVRIMDMRYLKREYIQRDVHSGDILDVDWHPTENWFVSTGHDNTVQVWDVGNEFNLIHTLKCDFPVKTVRWRPQSLYHISTISQNEHIALDIWDVRVSTLKFGYIRQHTSSLVGMHWLSNGTNIVTTSSNGVALFNNIKDINLTNNYVASSCFDISLGGDIVCGVSNLDGSYRKYCIDDNFGESNEPFHFPLNTKILTNKIVQNPFQHLPYLAENYLYKYGIDIEAICQYNSKIAHVMNLTEYCLTWKFLELIARYNNKPLVVYQPSKPIELNFQSFNFIHKTKMPKRSTPKNDQQNLDKCVGLLPALKEAPIECNFCDNETFPCYTFLDNTTTSQNSRSKPCFSSRLKSFILPQQSTRSEMELFFERIKKLVIEPTDYTWDSTDYSELLYEIFEYYAEKNDIQMCSIIALVFGVNNQLFKSISFKNINLNNYLKLYSKYLERFQLYVIRSNILKSINDVESETLINTRVKIMCSLCDKVIDCIDESSQLKLNVLSQHNDTTQCLSYHSVVCCLCLDVVDSGIAVWCHVCGHGGHLLHWNEWFGENNECPAGCGDHCTL